MDRTKGLLSQAKFVVFDLDGTIVHLAVDWVALKNELHSHFLSCRSLSIPFERLGSGLNVVETQLGHAGLKEAYEILRRYEAEGVENSTPHPLAGELIRELSVAGKRLAIFSSNMHATIRLSLEKMGWNRFFGPVVGSDDIQRRKPDPEGLLMILEHFRASPQEVVYIGDQPHDLDVAASCGVRFCLIHQLEEICEGDGSRLRCK